MSLNVQVWKDVGFSQVAKRIRLMGNVGCSVLEPSDTRKHTCAPFLSLFSPSMKWTVILNDWPSSLA